MSTEDIRTLRRLVYQGKYIYVYICILHISQYLSESTDVLLDNLGSYFTGSKFNRKKPKRRHSGFSRRQSSNRKYKVPVRFVGNDRVVVTIIHCVVEGLKGVKNRENVLYTPN